MTQDDDQLTIEDFASQQRDHAHSKLLRWAKRQINIPVFRDGTNMIAPGGDPIQTKILSNGALPTGQTAPLLLKNGLAIADAKSRKKVDEQFRPIKIGKIKVFVFVETANNYEFWVGGHTPEPKLALSLSKQTYKTMTALSSMAGDAIGENQHDWVLGVKMVDAVKFPINYNNKIGALLTIQYCHLFTIYGDGRSYHYEGYKAFYLNYKRNGFWSSDIIDPEASVTSTSNTVGTGGIGQYAAGTVTYDDGSTSATIIYPYLNNSTVTQGDGTKQSNTVTTATQVAADNLIGIQALFPSQTAAGGQYTSTTNDAWNPIPSNNGVQLPFGSLCSTPWSALVTVGGILQGNGSTSANSSVAHSTYAIAYFNGQLLSATGQTTITSSQTGSSSYQSVPAGFATITWGCQCVAIPSLNRSQLAPAVIADDETHVNFTNATSTVTSTTTASNPIFIGNNIIQNAITNITSSSSQTYPNNATSSLSGTQDSFLQVFISFDNGNGAIYNKITNSGNLLNTVTQKQVVLTKTTTYEFAQLNFYSDFVFNYDANNNFRALQVRLSNNTVVPNGIDPNAVLTQEVKNVPIDKYVPGANSFIQDTTYVKSLFIYKMTKVQTNNPIKPPNFFDFSCYLND